MVEISEFLRNRRATAQIAIAVLLITCTPGARAADVDPLSPAGVSLGMTLPKAEQILTANGYRKLSPCVFVKRNGAESYNLSLGTGSHCDPGRAIDHINYEQTGVPVAGTPGAITNRLGAGLGAAPECRRLDDQTAFCIWSSPASAPNVNIQMRYEAHSPSLGLILNANENVAETESPAPLALDPLAPEGIALGMDLAEVDSVLTRSEFTRIQPCQYSRYKPDSVRIFVRAGRRCDDGEPVNRINYVRGKNAEHSDAMILTNQWNDRIGAEGKCVVLNQSQAYCTWSTPKDLPGVASIRLEFQTQPPAQLQLLLEGTVSRLSTVATGSIQTPTGNGSPKAQRNDSTSVAVAQPSQPQPGSKSQRSTPSVSAQGVRFELSEVYQQLSSEDQQRFGTEAKMIYEYCQGRSTFAAFHECGCVAGKFIDERYMRIKDAGDVAVPSSNRDRIAIADEVADQCPNREGAMGYAARQCEGYSVMIPDPAGKKAFCDCYSESFASAYMEEPRSTAQNLVGVGAAAMDACDKKGLPTPMHPNRTLE